MSNTEDFVTTCSKKVHLISLGCARNRVDSEVMLGALIEKGWEITDEPEDSDAIVVNTCGFIESAKQESIDSILEATEYKSTGRPKRVVVAGCLTQRYKTQLAKGLPEVDFFIGTDEFPKIAGFLEDPVGQHQNKVNAKRTNYIYEGELPRLNTLDKASAYVKVAEGCQHQCSFCIIPAIRGPLRSRPLATVVDEVSRLVDGGVVEINLIAQDLAAYGRETGETSLLSLLKELVKIEKLQWIRLLYVYPENIQDDFLDFWAAEPKILPYIDIPMQHGSDAVLKRMSRDVTQKELLRTIERVRTRINGVAIRTSVMVGFPQETDEEFRELLGFIEEASFDHLGCFTYSQEEGTVAGRMTGQVVEEIKQHRLQEVMELQKKISRRKLQEKVGQVLPVLVKGLSDESDFLYQGRSLFQAPEVDGLVYINDGEPEIGRINKVKITEAHEYDLIGEVIKA